MKTEEFSVSLAQNLILFFNRRFSFLFLFLMFGFQPSPLNSSGFLVPYSDPEVKKNEEGITILNTTGTGRTTGHIADINLSSSFSEEQQIAAAVFFIPSRNDYQSYVGRIPEPVKISPGETKTIPVYGYCADVGVPPVPDGRSMPQIHDWVPVGTPEPGINIFPKTPEDPYDPEEIEVCGKNQPFFPLPFISNGINQLGDFLPTWPGTPIPTGGFTDPTENLSGFPSYLVGVLERIERTTTELTEAGLITTPFSGNREREYEAIVQQSFWITTAAVTGGDYNIEDFRSTTYEQFERSTGREIKDLSENELVGLDDGIDRFWSTFTTIGYESLVFKPVPQTTSKINIVGPKAPCVGKVTVDLSEPEITVQYETTGEMVCMSTVVYANACGRFPVPPDTPIPPDTPVPEDEETPPADRDQTPERPDSPRTGPTLPGGPERPIPGISLPGGENTISIPTDAFPAEGYTPQMAFPPDWGGTFPKSGSELLPGWKWEGDNPVWEGLCDTPPDRKVLGKTSFQRPEYTLETYSSPSVHEINVPLEKYLEPGQAFIYQLYGTVVGTDGVVKGVLSEPQCFRYMPPVTTGPPPEPVACDPCLVSVRFESGPEMDGGLSPPNDSLVIYRDEFIPLFAEGADYDELWWECQPQPECRETPSQDMVPLTGRVKFDWNIISGEGSFVELGCLNPNSYQEGNRVIFKPPYVPIDSIKTTKVKLRIIDDNPTQPIDPTVEREITIKTKRTSDQPDEYRISINSDNYSLPSPSEPPDLPKGSCLTMGPVWDMDNNLTTANIELPAVPDNKKMVYGEWMRLRASDIRDPDQYEVFCETECPTVPLTGSVEDNVEFEWSVVSGGGRFIKGNIGRYIIYEAPEQAGEVTISVRVYNPEGIQIIDSPPEPDTVKIEVFQPGVRMDTTALAWLPEDGIELEKRSYLVYKENDEWKEALPHQCRIHFFELMDVSQERGVCLNWPPYETADTCQDLHIRELERYEVFDSTSCERWIRGTPDQKENTAYFMKARTKEAEIEYTVTVISDDYGGFGFMRSIANGSQSTETPYKSVEWTREEKRHPQGRQKAVVYQDNRVTIPRDIDGNRIADGGWRPNFGAFQNDPEDAAVDRDTSRNNQFRGDGLPAYEEYRGFFIRGRHQRLNLDVKELFVYDRHGIGLGFFNHANTGIQAWRVDRLEMDTLEARSRCINFNRGTHELGFDQKGLRLYRDNNLGNDLLGVALNSVGPGDDGINTCDSVIVNVTATNISATPLANVIAHELAHGVSVRHHGEGIIRGFLNHNDRVNIDNAWRINTTGNVVNLSIACTGGLTSGNVRCFMRYDNYINFEPNEIALRNTNCANNSADMNLVNRRISRLNDNVAGNNLCLSNNGTGVNTNNRGGGNATLGNCINEIRISGQRP